MTAYKNGRITTVAVVDWLAIFDPHHLHHHYRHYPDLIYHHQHYLRILIVIITRVVVVDAQTFLIPNFTYNGQVDLERNQKFLKNTRTLNARKENIAKRLDIRVQTRISGLERVADLDPR